MRHILALGWRTSGPVHFLLLLFCSPLDHAIGVWLFGIFAWRETVSGLSFLHRRWTVGSVSSKTATLRLLLRLQRETKKAHDPLSWLWLNRWQLVLGSFFLFFFPFYLLRVLASAVYIVHYNINDGNGNLGFRGMRIAIEPILIGLKIFTPLIVVTSRYVCGRLDYVLLVRGSFLGRDVICEIYDMFRRDDHERCWCSWCSATYTVFVFLLPRP